MILVTGATGNMGRPLVRRLIEAGAEVRAITRNFQKARATLPSGIDVLVGDLHRPEFRRQALVGVDKVFVQLDAGEAKAILSAAADAGVRQVVLVTSLNAEVRPQGFVGSGSLAVEQRMRECDLRGTVLRPWEFASNSLNLAREIRTTGVVRKPAGSRPSPTIDPADVASVATTVLTEDGHDGLTYSLTGPAEIDSADKIAVIGRAVGRDLVFEEYHDPEQDKVVRDTPDQVSASYGVCYIESPGVLTTVEDVTGKPARSYEQWVAENVARFR
jgi:uncharacterized protein YbjT (DUF2867 family)